MVVVGRSVSSPPFSDAEELSAGGDLTGASSTGFGISTVVAETAAESGVDAPLSEEEARVTERREKRFVERRESESEILGVRLGFWSDEVIGGENSAMDMDILLLSLVCSQFLRVGFECVV